MNIQNRRRVGFVLPHEIEELSEVEPIQEVSSNQEIVGSSDLLCETHDRLKNARVVMLTKRFANWSDQRKAKHILELEWLVKMEVELNKMS